MKTLSTKILFTSAAALAMFGFSAVASADELQPVETVAQQVINGNFGNGQERIDKLTAQGYVYQDVQDKVNEIWFGTVKVEAPVQEATTQQSAPAETTDVSNVQVEQTPAAPVQEATPAPAETQEQTTPVTSAVGIDLSQTSGAVDINALANYMVTSTTNNPGYSASEWAYIINAESGGSLTATNASSGAYGAFQLLGHGEYSGMTLAEQINMAAALPAGSWVVYN